MIVNGQVPASKSNEGLLNSIIKYLAEITFNPNSHDFFKANMVPLFQLLIIPNISLTEDDVNEYEDEPDTFIRNDLEESDTDSRRRQCMKFVQSLMRYFPNEVNAIIGESVSTLLAEYEQNRKYHYIKKITVLNLIITASITNYTYKSGAENLNISNELLTQYIQQLVVPELTEEKFDNLKLLKATCIKFVYMFRNQIADGLVENFVVQICNFLKSESPVNQSYAAACIEKLLTRKQLATGNLIFVPG